MGCCNSGQTDSATTQNNVTVNDNDGPPDVFQLLGNRSEITFYETDSCYVTAYKSGLTTVKPTPKLGESKSNSNPNNKETTSKAGLTMLMYDFVEAINYFQINIDSFESFAAAYIFLSNLVKILSKINIDKSLNRLLSQCQSKLSRKCDRMMDRLRLCQLLPMMHYFFHDNDKNMEIDDLSMIEMICGTMGYWDGNVKNEISSWLDKNILKNEKVDSSWKHYFSVNCPNCLVDAKILNNYLVDAQSVISRKDVLRLGVEYEKEKKHKENEDIENKEKEPLMAGVFQGLSISIEDTFLETLRARTKGTENIDIDMSWNQVSLQSVLLQMIHFASNTHFKYITDLNISDKTYQYLVSFFYVKFAQIEYFIIFINKAFAYVRRVNGKRHKWLHIQSLLYHHEGTKGSVRNTPLLRQNLDKYYLNDQNCVDAKDYWTHEIKEKQSSLIPTIVENIKKLRIAFPKNFAVRYMRVELENVTFNIQSTILLRYLCLMNDFGAFLHYVRAFVTPARADHLTLDVTRADCERARTYFLDRMVYDKIEINSDRPDLDAFTVSKIDYNVLTNKFELSKNKLVITKDYIDRYSVKYEHFVPAAAIKLFHLYCHEEIHNIHRGDQELPRLSCIGYPIMLGGNSSKDQSKYYIEGGGAAIAILSGGELALNSRELDKDFLRLQIELFADVNPEKRRFIFILARNQNGVDIMAEQYDKLTKEYQFPNFKQYLDSASQGGNKRNETDGSMEPSTSYVDEENVIHCATGHPDIEDDSD